MVAAEEFRARWKYSMSAASEEMFLIVRRDDDQRPPQVLPEAGNEESPRAAGKTRTRRHPLRPRRVSEAMRRKSAARRKSAKALQVCASLLV